MFKSLVALSTLALAVAATPLKRSGGPWCDNFFSGFDIAHGFSLVAVQSSGDAANAPTTPLTMGSGGAIDGAAFHTLSTVASSPFGDPNQTWALANGTLLPEDQTSAQFQGGSVADGSTISWMSSTTVDPSPQIWCAVASTSPMGGNSVLAVNGVMDGFSLCKQWDADNAQVNVVYKASANGSGYIFDSCQPVFIELLHPDRS